MLVASKLDIAGLNIAKECEKLGLNVHYVEEDLIKIKNLPKAEYYIFLSKHKSESKKPCLTCHFPGNFGEDVSYGGNVKELGVAYPSLEKIFMRNLIKAKKELQREELEKYQIVIEATHHGPTHFKEPVLFVEIGSSEKEWTEKSAAEVVGLAVKRTVETANEHFSKIGIGFGGTHYSEKFTKVIIDSQFAIGHVFPKYQIKNINEEIFNQLCEKSAEEIKYVLIDWKGMSKKDLIIKWAKNKGLEIVKI